MSEFNYGAPAELFLRRMGEARKQLRYQRFDTAAAAIQFVAEGKGAQKFSLATLEVEDGRFEKADILRLYHAADYPLERSGAAPE